MTTDGRLVSGSVDKSIKIWDLKSGKCENTLNGHSRGGMQILYRLSDYSNVFYYQFLLIVFDLSSPSVYVRFYFH